MMQHEAVYLQDQEEEGFEAYRSVSKAAVLSLLLGLVSPIGLLFPLFLPLGLLGLFFGIFGYRSIREFPDEISGKVPAVLGALLCGLVFIGGTVTHSVIYATEVPEGYQRVSFASLMAREGPDVPPLEILDLDGQQIFIKGYVYPDGQKSGIKRFVLVPDMGTCCFGGQPKLTHMIEVTLAGSLSIDYSMTKRRFAGTLKVDRALKPVDGLQGVYYQLTADYAR